MNASILVDHQPTPDPDRHIVRVLLRVEGPAPSRDERVPLNLALVLDRSGSMAGEPLRHVRDAAKQLLSHVYPDDTTSVVTFETDVDVVAAAAPRRTQKDLGYRVASIRSGGSTNLSGGWMEGRSQIRRHYSDRASNRILLMTDGLANQGITDPERLAELFRAARAQGVTTSTVGFGPHFDERLLETLADAGGGNTHYVEHPDQAPDVFRAELDELLALSAQNLTVDVLPGSGVELAAVHHSYPRQAIADGLRLRLGDLYASEPKQLLVSLQAYAPAGDDVDLAQLELRADVVADEGGIEQRTLSLPIRFDPRAGPVVNPEVRRTLVFLEAAAARRDALEDERRGLFDQAARRLRTAAHELLALADDDEGHEEAEDLELMASHLDEGALMASDLKYMHARSYGSLRAKLSHKSIHARTRIGRSGPERVKRGDGPSRSGRGPDSERN